MQKSKASLDITRTTSLQKGNQRSVTSRPISKIGNVLTDKTLGVSVINVSLTASGEGVVEWTGVTTAAVPWIARRKLASRPLSNPPNSWMWLAILTSVLCACPLGFAAVYWSYRSRSAARNGDYWRARSAAKASVCMSFAGIIFGVFTATVVIIIHAATDKL